MATYREDSNKHPNISFRLVFVLILVVLAILGCKAPEVAEPVVLVAEEPTATPEPTAPLEPTLEPSPTVTPSPTVATLDEAALHETGHGYLPLHETGRGYLPLLLVEVIVSMLEETAVQVQAGDIDGGEGLGRLIAIAAFRQVANEDLASGPPHPAWREAWSEGKEAVALAGEVLVLWYDGEITSAEVPELLGPAQERAQRTMELADAVMSREYGISETDLATLRAKTMEDLRDEIREVAAPEPEPTAPPERERGASRRNPAVIGDVFIVERSNWLRGKSTIELELRSIVAGDEAWKRVYAANMFNDEPKAGQEYILALFRVVALSLENEPLELRHTMFDAVSAGGVVYSGFLSVAGLEPAWRTELYEGAEHEGWVYFLVDKDDAPVAAFDRGDDHEVWFALRP